MPAIGLDGSPGNLSVTVSLQPDTLTAWQDCPHMLDDAVHRPAPVSEPRMRQPCGQPSEHDAAALHALQVARVHARLARQRHAARARHLQDACARSTLSCIDLKALAMPMSTCTVRPPQGPQGRPWSQRARM